ncbi:MAG: DUF1801 domain-containing protein [Saprospiraceae bacterium]|nr:DUF1801 domain-containing protein [Saprospiraceae bacterium]
MAKAKNKTTANTKSVTSFLESIENDQKRKDSFRILEMMRKLTGKEPVMWGSSIVGFGEYHYVYETGREGDMMKIGFSPRKQNLTLYIMPGFDRYAELMSSLGKYKTGKSCLYIRRLEDVNLEVLIDLMQSSYNHMTKKYG